MKRQYKRAIPCILTLALLFTSAVIPTFAGNSSDASSADLVKQNLNYTENPVDIPNPDRGFERGNDDAAGLGATDPKNPGGSYWAYMTVPASADTILGQHFNMAYEMTPPYYLGGDGKDPKYCNVPVEPRIVQFYLVLNNFSSNAWCDSTPGDPGAHTRQGADGPITQYGLDYIRQQLEFIRTHTNSVAHIRVCYDPKGWNQFVWSENNLKYQDKGPADKDKTYYIADQTKPVAAENLAAHIAKPVAGTWRGSSPIFRKCTVPGFTDMNWVQYHYHQLKPIFQEYSDVIWAFDSGTFGPWGESHSNYDAEVPANYKMSLDALLDAVPDGKPIMTHIGGFLAWYNRTYHTTYTFGTLDTMPAPVRGTPEARFGMFDDSNGWSADEYSYNDCGSLSEGYRMLAHDPTLQGYNPTAKDPSMTREGVASVIGYNDKGTNSLRDISDKLDDPRWRGVWFYDFNRTKLENFLGKMSVYGGEQIGDEPDSGTNGGLIEPKPEDNTPDDTQRRGRVDSPYNDVILRFPSILYESSIDHMTYFCMQQGSSSFKSRADYPYTKDKINVDITYPWNGQKVKVLYDPVYEGQSTLAYFRDRMGYRLVLREAYANRSVAQNDTLKFEGKIQNVGWNDVFNKKAVKVILKSKSGGFVSNAVLTNIDPYDWHPAEAGPHGEMPDSTANNKGAFRDLSFNIPMSAFGNVPVGKYDIYLKINDPKETTVNKRSIRFANKGDGIWDENLGANLIGSTTVTDTVNIVTDNATGAQKITVKSPDGTVAELDKPKSGNMTGTVTLGRNAKNAVITIPMKEADGGTVAIITNQDGTEEIVKESVADGGILYVPVNGDVTIKIVQNGMDFADANKAAWAKDAISFVTAREMFLGTGKEGFSPNQAMTRGMLVTVLYRLAGEPSVGANSFTDVAEGKYYTDAVAWAAKSGIVAGVGNNQFAQGREITREQLAAMLYHFAGSPEVSGTLTGFSDADRDSDWAKPAIIWANKQGITQGRTATTFAPGAKATRAEVAAMLQRFVTDSATD